MKFNATNKKSAYALGIAGVLSAVAFTLAIAAPTPAEARVVCRDGWGWKNDRCVEIRDRHDNDRRDYRDHGPRYRVGGYIPRGVSYRALPRDRWSRYQRIPVGYRYIMAGNDVLLLDRKGRIVRIYD